ncbi:hypothetical protein [Endozoicomonas elysicola]|uniref:Uncharacterized protein n=1 Tax=Endozoicomonas elysicola TaxID=305900 RepID=A0A081K980_9GAMM|nr:hypothetical protein [Endozoicomonas elysicola]KEI70706.1 hypothetical protein GV64_08090 [Endozoicomonas elysicola]
MDGNGQIPRVGNPTPANITQPSTSDATDSVDQEPGKTDKGQKVSKFSKFKGLFSKKSNKSEGKDKTGKKTLAKRETKSNESAKPAKGLRKESLGDDRHRALADGLPGAFAGSEGLLADAVMDRVAGQAAAQGSADVQPTEALLQAPEQTPLEESDQLLQIVKDSAQAGIVKDEIEGLVDRWQKTLDSAIDLQESFQAQRDGVSQALSEKNELLSTAQESQSQLSQQVADGTSQVNQLQTEVASIQGSINEQNQLIAEQQNVLNELQSDLTAAQDHLDAANQGVDDGFNDAANQAVDKLKILVEEHQTTLANQQSQLASMESALEARNTELGSAQTELAGLQGQLAEAENSVNTLTEETSTLQGQLQVLEQDYAQASEHVSELEDQLSQLNTLNDAANDAAEAGELETVQDLLAEAKVITADHDAFDPDALAASDAAEVAASESAGAAEYISSLLDPVSAGVDVGVGIVAHSITLGLKGYKLSKLRNRQEAFDKCGDVIERWKGAGKDGAEKASVQDLKDYALVAKLADDGSIERTNPLRSVLGDSKCHFSHDGKMLKLAENLIKIAGDIDGSKSSDIPKDMRGKSIADQLKQWKSDFEEKGKEFTEGQKAKKARSEDGKKLLKHGHQSKRLMQQFNAIVKPLGVEMEYKLPTFKKFGESALATQHRFVVDEKKLHAHLTKTEKHLPSQGDVKKQVLVHQDDAPALKTFANYEQRKIDHQISQMKWTGAALATAGIPVLKIDYGVRAGREFSEAKFRTENNKLLDSKLTKIAAFAQKQMSALEFKNKTPEEKEKAISSGLVSEKTVGSYSSSLTDALELASKVIHAKKDRTQVKMGSAIAQGTIDTVGATAGSAAAVFAPGVGSLAADVAVGAAKLTAAGVSIGARSHVDKKNQQFGRIETQVYSELKGAYNNPKSSEGEKSDLLELTQSLFDIDEGQAKMLFKQSDDRDLVSEKGKIRLRFTNIPVGESK